MLRSLLALANEHVLRPFDLMVARRSHVPCYANSAVQKMGGKRVAFFHAPKCGGTSVNQGLAKAFGGPAGIDPIAAEAASRNLGLSRMELREAILAYFVQRNDVRFISGHYSYSRRAFAGREGEFDLITILRNPLDRMLSQYYYNRFGKHPNHIPIRSDLSEWLMTEPARSAATVFTKMFVGEITATTALDEGNQRDDMKAAAEEAIDNLSRFAIVGTLEHLAAFEEAIRRRYKVDFSIGHLRKSPKAGYPKFAEQPPQIRDRILELCREDLAIYDRFATEPQPEGALHRHPEGSLITHHLT